MGGTVRSLEVGNQRRVAAGLITSNVTLSASHGNRFTRVAANAGVVVTVAGYPDILDGAEHEFFNDGPGDVTFAAGPGTALRSVDGRYLLPVYGCALVKYLGTATFALIGALI